ncbi:alpha/beta hydrolase family protein [Halomonas sp. LBP4]|uniref:alpha/beta hydrolase family protein n=1 Tax=Halomonas sp. LBP4 TaxID=2044917 RepID=UPI000D75F62E|nr:alpha/beta fold hydrolase [Halomonas sp. LBP4]PXX94855.1 alpha/beta hydrolase [Halomonas sp. LBP4]
MPHSITFKAADGFRLHGHEWRHAQADPSRPVVVINPATSVASRYYHRFAAYLHEHDMDVVTYDYRGIGASRPPASLRRLKASWFDWGEQDCEGALRHARAQFPGQPLDVVAHSIGGFALGLAPSNVEVRRVVTMGSQFAYWRDYPPELRRGMLLKWHLAMPLLAVALGYVPAKRLGWMEDTPRGVALDWSTMRPGFERNFRHRSPQGARLASQRLERFAGLRAPLLALSVTDDPFGTEAAIERLLGYYTSSPRTHLRLAPQDIDAAQIGHFAFFHDRFRDSLWPIALEWLTQEALAEMPRSRAIHDFESSSSRLTTHCTTVIR